MRTFLICLLVVALLGFALADEGREKRVFEGVKDAAKSLWKGIKGLGKAIYQPVQNSSFIGDVGRTALRWSMRTQIRKGTRKFLKAFDKD
ncbi:hypothetical protein ElyMa_001564000 [Elysia marginata]|uniref:Uncharacterized protein n=1 Tax=Elysia marginata TaxID=1093978 RepID=A0AAV4JD43_9GAST|nr:hypothetical protein ElyMa_001564000 [Elysia marginata]